MFYRNKFGRYNRYDYNWRGIQRKRFRGFTCKILLKNVKTTISNDEIKKKIQLATKKEAEKIVFRAYSRMYREDIKLAIVQMENSHDATFVKNRMNGTRMENYTMYASYYWDRNNRNEKQKQQYNRKLNKANHDKNKEKNKKEEIVKKQKEKKKKEKTKEIKTKEKNKQRIQNTVFVGNLNRNTKEKEIMELMHDFDPEEVEIVKGNNGKSKRFGFVSFKNKKDASYALNYNNYCFMGNKIRVNLAIEEKFTKIQKTKRKNVMEIDEISKTKRMINQFKISREKIKIIRIRGERAQKKIEIKLSQLEEKLKVLRKLELEERKEVIDVNKIIEKIFNNKKTTQSKDVKKQKIEIIKQPEEEEEDKREIKSNKQKEIEIEIEKNTRNQDIIAESDCQKEETYENNILNQKEVKETIEKFSSNQENKEINKENIIPKDNSEKVQTQNTDQIQEEKKIENPQNKKNRTEK
ncbi:RNA recognition motif rrm domain containing protein [Anaeramoeba flamelloides]|uniref:RNA recognition motif rrm domain containing protein n=1 Tax=Anaeramoeba flamelloides TaxID=1746091 RepID=A0ABQ8ZF94_9EUKA|nr:RNA recognition motif rrm domain containing protein [Anaeramoeba flamelloides]